MKHIILTTVFSIGLLASAEARAQEEKVWTLDDCMRYAVENAPSVKKQIHTANTYKAERDAAIASFFPSVGTSIGTSNSYGRSIDPATNTYNNVSTFNNDYGISFSIPVFTGGQLINQWLMAKSNRRMGLNDVQKAKDDLALKTMEYYMNTVYYLGTIRMAEEKLAESQLTLRQTQRQAELGLKSQADVAEFEAQVATDDYNLTHQQNLYNTAMVQLKESMNYPADSALVVDTVVPDLQIIPEAESVSEIFDYASANNPTALQADFQLKEAKYQYRIYKGALLPTISFSAGVGTNYYKSLSGDAETLPFGEQFRNNRSEYFQFSLSFPLFNGLSKITNLRRSRNNLRIAQETKTEVLRQLRTAVEQSVLDRRGYAKETIQMQKKVKSDALAYQVTSRKYEEGLMSPIDVRTSSATLLTSRADLLQKKLMYIIKCKLVDYYKGKPLY